MTLSLSQVSLCVEVPDPLKPFFLCLSTLGYYNHDF
jgi:hypothetical protein